MLYNINLFNINFVLCNEFATVKLNYMPSVLAGEIVRLYRYASRARKIELPVSRFDCRFVLS